MRNAITSSNMESIPMDALFAALNGKGHTMPVEINLNDYAVAVAKLVTLARKDCGGSRAAAQVVLSLYNGHNWHVNLIDLTVLDSDHFCAAITAIRGRVRFNREPHEMIPNGDDVFDRLQDDWKHYHVKQRYAQSN